MSAPNERPRVWNLRSTIIPLDDPIVMGILNVTPDSFSDGGVHASTAGAVTAGLQMIEDGAAIVDIGGESTRPGAAPVSTTDEIARVLPVVEQLATRSIPVSVDTSKPDVARAVIEAGAMVINDVTGLSNPEMRDVCAASGVGVVIMHMQGTPRTMQENPQYGDVVREVTDYLVAQATAAEAAGVRPGSIVIDPGIGFGKSFDHNIELLTGLHALASTDYPLLVGTSRKGFLGKILEPIRGITKPAERDAATAATTALAVAAGAMIIRAHNVPLTVDVAVAARAIVPHDDGEETNRT